MDYSDRRTAERVASALQALELPNPHFRQMHHGDTLKPTEGITEHVRWLRSNNAALTGGQRALAERLHVLVEAWFAQGSWDTAAAIALAAVPKR